jgi:hypothetical protein
MALMPRQLPSVALGFEQGEFERSRRRYRSKRNHRKHALDCKMLRPKFITPWCPPEAAASSVAMLPLPSKRSLRALRG